MSEEFDFTRAEVMTAWACVRRHDSSIPDECLDQMRDALLAIAADAQQAEPAKEGL